jgi:Fic family protein
MADLERFLARDDLPALLQAGIAHAQFETIHPFIDGNGRIGRALIHGVLRRRDASSRVPVPISAALLADRDGYLAGLTAYQQYGDLHTWLRRFAASCSEAAYAGQRLGDQLADLEQRWRTRPGTPRRGSHPRQLLDHLIAYPVVNAAVTAQLLDTDSRQARRALDRLTELGVLQVSGGQRNRTWRAHELLELLEEFQADIVGG